MQFGNLEMAPKGNAVLTEAKNFVSSDSLPSSFFEFGVFRLRFTSLFQYCMTCTCAVAALGQTCSSAENTRASAVNDALKETLTRRCVAVEWHHPIQQPPAACRL